MVSLTGAFHTPLLNNAQATETTPTMYVNPPVILNSSATSGTYFTVTINVTSVPSPGLWGYEFYLNWTGPVLNVTTALQGGGSMLSKGGSVFFTAKKYNEPSNFVYVTATLMGTPYQTAYPVTGSGGLAVIKFKVTSDLNNTILHLYGTTLYTLGNPPTYPITTMEHTTDDGYFSNIPGESHDIIILDVNASKTHALDGEIIHVDVSIFNNGTVTETVNVSLFYNSTLIQTQEVTLASLVGVAVRFDWNTTEIAPGTYILKAVTMRAPGETNTANNAFTDGAITVYYTHNIIVTNVTLTPTSVYVGQAVNISVTAQNGGVVTDTFNITVFYDGNSIGTQTVPDLPPNNQTIVKFSWNTTGVAPGAYGITAVASTVPGETYTVDNTRSGGTVTVSLQHDIAMVSIYVSENTALPGEIVDVTVTAENRGEATDSFVLAAYHNTTSIGAQTVTSLPPGTQATRILHWNTTGFEIGKYQISAQATIVPGEINVTNNIMIDGMVSIVGQKTIDHAFTVDATIYHVVTVSNSSILFLGFNTISGGKGELNFNVTGPADTKGFINVTIPKTLMWGDSQAWIISLDSVVLPPGNYTWTQNSTHTSVYILYNQSTQTIGIVAYAVPEFPAAALLPLLIIITLLGIVLRSKRLPKKRNAPLFEGENT